MKIEPLKIGELIAKVPIIQGGMGIGISLGNLAGTVAREGGIGLISAAQIGFRDEEFQRDPKAANLKAIHREYQKARAIAPDGIIGFNIMVAMKSYDEYVKEAARAGADIIVSGAGLPTDLPGYVAGYTTKIAPIVSTEKSAKVILKYWDRKYQRTADLIVIEGPKAGGHLGFSNEQLEQYDEAAYEAEIDAILSLIKVYEEKYQQPIPVVIGGGMDTAKKVRRAFELGADGVQVGSRFVTTEECDADVAYKNCYLKAQEQDVVIVKSPVGMPGRAIKNQLMEAVAKGQKFTPAHCKGCLAHCNPKEIPYCITERLIYAAEGRTDEALLFCGANAYQAERIETVKEVMSSLIDEM